MKQNSLSASAAEAIAAKALLFLSCEPDRLERFMALSGMDVETLMQYAQDRATLAGVLDYILSDEALVLGLAEFAGIAPQAPAAALRLLGGGTEF